MYLRDGGEIIELHQGLHRRLHGLGVSGRQQLPQVSVGANRQHEVRAEREGRRRWRAGPEQDGRVLSQLGIVVARPCAAVHHQ